MTRGTSRSKPAKWAWLNGLALAMFGAFLVFVTLQSIFGWRLRNEDLIQSGQPPDSYLHYVVTGHFIEAMLENWESEFLEMGSYILLTAYLVQRGSPESKEPGQKDRPGDDPTRANEASPRFSRPGLGQMLYRNSLALVLLLFFAGSFVGHLIAGTAAYNEQQALQGQGPPLSTWEFLRTPTFWFQSMQNWQSEFLGIGTLIVLSIVLRQHGSPESKPVTAPHAKTTE